jgi:hypothetical protein
LKVLAVGWGDEGSEDLHSALGFKAEALGPWPCEPERLGKVGQAFRPDVVVTFADVWMLEPLAEAMGGLGVSWVGAIPLDSAQMPARWQAVLEKMTARVSCAAFGQRVLQEYGIHSQCIPLGVETGVFRPLPDRAALRVEQRLDGRFVIGCIARNQPRKQLPLLLRAFARFAPQHADAVLYLHTGVVDVGGDLRDLIARFGISDRTLISRSLLPVKGIGDEELVRVYNLFDVFVLPTMGEGFGLPILEAMACGVPVLATDCSAVTELVQGRGELIRVKEWLTVGPYNVDMAIADGDHLVELLEKLYRDPDLRAEYARQGRAFAETMTWDRCAAAWDELLQQVVESRGREPRPPEGVVWAAWPQVSIVLLVAEDSVAALDRSLTSIDQNLRIRGQVIVVRESDDPAVCARLDAWRRRDLAILPGFNGRNRAERLEMALRLAQARRVLRLDSGETLEDDWPQRTIEAVRPDVPGWGEFVASVQRSAVHEPSTIIH